MWSRAWANSFTGYKRDDCIVSSLEVDLGYNNASQIKRELLSTPVHYYADVIIIIDNKGKANKSRGSATFTSMAASEMI